MWWIDVLWGVGILVAFFGGGAVGMWFDDESAFAVVGMALATTAIYLFTMNAIRY